MDDQRGAVGWQDIVLQAVKCDGFLNACLRLCGIPRRGVDESVDGALPGGVSQLPGKFFFQLPDATNRVDIFPGIQPLVEII